MQNLPNFKYYPDPIKGGSISESEKTCEVCNKKRGAKPPKFGSK